MKTIQSQVLILDHGERLGGVEKFIASVIDEIEEYSFERVCVDAANLRLGYLVYVIRILLRVQRHPAVVVSCHIDTSMLGYELAQYFNCPHIFREPSGVEHAFMTQSSALVFEESTCVALSQSGLRRWRDKGFTGKGVVIPPFVPRVLSEPKKLRTKTISYKAVMVANLYPEKQHLCFLECLNILMETYEIKVLLDIIGNSNGDDYGKEVKRICAGNPQVCLHEGVLISDLDLFNYDFGVLASSNEGFGNVLVEFMQVGLPFMTTFTDGARDFLNRNSVLRLPDNPVFWPSALNKFLQSHGAVQKEMRELQLSLQNQESFTNAFKHVLDSQILARSRHPNRA